MMKLSHLKLKQKFILLNAFLLAVSLLSLSLVIYINQRAYILRQNEVRLQSHLEDMSNLLDLQIKEKQEQVNSALEVARHILQAQGEIVQSDTNLINFTAVNQISKEEQQIVLPAWRAGDIPLQHDFRIVDQIMQLTGQTATVFQKIDDGYLRISTNVRKLDGNRAVGTFIPNTSEVIQTIERGETYRGRAFVVNAWYVTAYEPIYVNGQIQGILYVGVQEKDLNFLKDKFYAKSFWENGYPYAFTGEGMMLIHSRLEDQDVSHEEAVEQMLSEKKGMLKAAWGGSDAEQEMVHVFTYYPFFNMILGIAVPNDELVEAPLNRLKAIVFGGFILALGLSMLILYLYINRQLSPLLSINHRLKLIARRKFVEPQEIRRTDEIGEINQSLNQLLTGTQEVSEFAGAIGKGDFSTEFKALGEDDILGNSLLQMRHNLQEVAREDKKRAWANEGFARFMGMMRNSQSDVQMMCNTILPELIRYLQANQGGIFIYEKNGERDGYLALTSMYAWNRMKTMEKKVYVEENFAEGIIGQAFLEKAAVYLTEVPDDFVRVTSGLGEANPTCILVQPLIYNENVYGVLEIASFREMAAHELDFIERLAESLASAIASLKVNQQTISLLDETRKQTEEITSKEEELRQNMEEMQATNEEMRRKEGEYLSVIEQLKSQLSEKELN
jgi:methyl-accepting chemotaxis protein